MIVAGERLSPPDEIKTTSTPRTALHTMEIYDLLPHRFPFLMIDRVLSCERGRSLRAVKNISFGELYLLGHFPTRPIFPGVLILEAAAQAAHILLTESAGEDLSGENIYLAAVRHARFRQPAYPGDQLHITVEIAGRCGEATRFGALVTAGERLICQATLTCVRRRKSAAEVIRSPRI